MPLKLQYRWKKKRFLKMKGNIKYNFQNNGFVKANRFRPKNPYLLPNRKWIFFSPRLYISDYFVNEKTVKYTDKYNVHVLHQ